MKFLIDENLPNAVLEYLVDQGHDAIKVHGGSSDTEVSALAQKHQRALLTLDKDFADILAYPPTEYYGIIVFRIKRPLISEIARMLGFILSKFDDSALKGKLIVISPTGYRVRERL